MGLRPRRDRLCWTAGRQGDIETDYGGTATGHTYGRHRVGDRASVDPGAGDPVLRGASVRLGHRRADRGRSRRAGGDHAAQARAAGRDEAAVARPIGIYPEGAREAAGDRAASGRSAAANGGAAGATPGPARDVGPAASRAWIVIARLQA